MFPGLQGGPLEHVIAAKAVAFREAAAPVVRRLRRPDRAQRRGAGRGPGRRGLPPRVGRHRQPPHAGRPARRSTPSSPARRPRRCSTGPASRSTRTPSPTTPASPFVTSGVRIGTPAVTTQGMTEAEMGDDRRAHRPGAARPGRRRRAGGGPRRRRHALLQVHALRAEPAGRRGDRGRALGAPTRSVLAVVAVTHLRRPCPLVRRLAFRIGAVVKPDERRVHERPTADPRRRRHARRAARRHGRGVAHGRVRRDLRRAAPSRSAWCIAAVADRGRRRDRRPPRGLGPGQDRRAWCWPPACWCSPASACWCSASRSSACSCCRPDWSLPAQRALGARHGQRHQPHRRARRAGRRHRGHRRRARSSSTRMRAAATRALLARRQHRPAHRRPRARHVPRLPAPQLPPGPDLHGRRRRAAARPADGGVDDGRRRSHRPAASAGSRSSSSPRCSSRS